MAGKTAKVARAQEGKQKNRVPPGVTQPASKLQVDTVYQPLPANTAPDTLLSISL